MLVMELADKSLMREIEERSLTKNYFQDDELHHIFL
jgi:NIMA (never in mitosis gene a)-related kinase